MGDDVITIFFDANVKAFKKGTQAVKTAVESLNRATRQFTNRAIGNFKRLIPLVAGVGSVFGILSKGVSTYLSQHEELGKKMNAVWTTIGNLIGPIIERIINLIATATSYFVGFMNALGITSKKASELSKSTGTLQKTLAGFDELNVLQDNGGGSLDDKELPELMGQLAEFLKNKMWDEAADLIIKKMNDLIYLFRDKAREFGEKAGEYLRGAIHIIARVLDEVDWKQLGVGIANFFNGLIPEGEAMKVGQDIGKILVSSFTIGFKIVTGFLEDPELLRKFADILSGIVIGALNSIATAIRGADFRQIGENIREFFERLWGNKDEIKAAIYAVLEEAWNAALDLLRGLFKVGEGEEDPPLIKSILKIKDTLVDDVIPAAKDFFETAWTKYLKPVLEWAVNKGLPELLKQVADTIEDLTKVLKDGDWSGFKDGLNGVEKALLALGAVKLITGIADLTSKVRSFVGLFTGGAGAGVTGSVTGLSTALGTLGTVLGVGGVAGLGVGFAMLLAHLGEVPLEAYQAERGTKLLSETLEGTSGSVMDLASAMNGFKETADQYDTVLNESIVGLDSTGLSLQQCEDASRAYQAALETMAQMLGISTEELKKQIDAAGGDVTQIKALNTATDDASVSQKEISANFGETKKQIDNLNKAIADNVNSGKTLRTANNQNVTSTKTVSDITGKYNKVLEGQNKALADTSKIVMETAQSVTEEATALEKGSSATDQAVQSTGKLVEGLGKTPKTASDAGSSVKTMGEDSDLATKKVAQSVKTMRTSYETDLNAVSNTTKRTWTDIKNNTNLTWNNIVQVVNAAMRNMTTGVNTSFTSMNTGIQRNMTVITNNVVNSFEQMGQRAVQSINGMVNSIGNSLSGLAREVTYAINDMSWALRDGLSELSYDAYYWGQDMMDSYADGINSRSYTVSNAVSGAAMGVKKFLGFSEPEEGPLSDFHTYGPDMMELYSSTILKSSSKVYGAVEKVAKGMADRLSGAELSVGTNLSALEGIGQNIQWKMPAVAGGGFLPYNVSATTGGNVETNASVADALARLNETIDGLQYALENMEWVAQFGNVRAVVREINKVQRQIERAEG